MKKIQILISDAHWMILTRLSQIDIDDRTLVDEQTELSFTPAIESLNGLSFTFYEQLLHKSIKRANKDK